MVLISFFLCGNINVLLLHNEHFHLTQSSRFLLRDISDNNELNGKALDMNANYYHEQIVQ